jgi:hypothetical protein
MEERLQAIEQAINNLQISLNSLVTKSELTAGINIKQDELDYLRVKLDSLKSQVSLLQALMVMQEY